MEKHLQLMIEEHAQLVKRIEKLHNYVYSNESDKDDKVEFANKCIQLTAMRKYEEALNTRLSNAGVVFDNDTYFEKIGTIKKDIEVEMPNAGNDFDLDKKSCEK